MTRLKTIPSRRAWRLAPLLAAAWLVGCAALAPTPQTPEEIVQARANARWAAMLKGDTATAYEYLAPGMRALITKEAYAARFGGAVRWVGAEATRARCPEATKCLATVRIDTKAFLSRMKNVTVPTYYEETWVLQDGQWWLFSNL